MAVYRVDAVDWLCRSIYVEAESIDEAKAKAMNGRWVRSEDFPIEERQLHGEPELTDEHAEGCLFCGGDLAWSGEQSSGDTVHQDGKCIDCGAVRRDWLDVVETEWISPQEQEECPSITSTCS